MDRSEGWAPAGGGYSCSGEHVGSGTLTIRGQNPNVTIDGSINGGGALTIVDGCELGVKDLTLKSGPERNSLDVYEKASRPRLL